MTEFVKKVIPLGVRSFADSGTSMECEAVAFFSQPDWVNWVAQDRDGQYIDRKKKQSSAKGHCTITVSSEDVAFAEWTCEGKVGACKGTFTLTGGTGKYAGVTGSSEMIVRSVLNVLVTGMGSGDAVRAGSGLAILPKLTYKLAKGK